MITLQSHVEGRWHAATDGFATLIDPCSEEPIARVSSAGVDFGAALDFAREKGGAALRSMTIGERAELLASMSRALHERRDDLIAMSLDNTGATRKDAKFDIDGGTFTLSHYAALGAELGDRRVFDEGDGIQLGRTARFWGQHVLLPRAGAAVLVNAFNFPVWGFAEKAACALLAGMPVITKPATSSALVTEACVRILVEAGVAPDGVLSLICGSTGDLLDRLGPQDVFSFTGSAATALKLRSKTNLLESSTAVNIEADSLNSAVIGPDVASDSETWAVFVRDVAREMTQKTGQKCTAVRRVFVPADRMDEVQEALIAALSETVVGNPRDRSVTMGPLATAGQLRDAVEGVVRLSGESDVVHGTGERVDGNANPAGKGYFFAPTLLRARDPERTEITHTTEVFAPVATLIPYDGSGDEAGRGVARGGGSLVTSAYSNDVNFLGKFLAQAGPASGRVYMGSEKVAAQLPGSGLVMPHVMHGGPGRAGGGEELGGMRGLNLYLQRVAVTGDRAIVERLAGKTR